MKYCYIIYYVAPPTRVISATTSKKKKPIRKSQISAPLDYIDTPEVCLDRSHNVTI